MRPHVLVFSTLDPAVEEIIGRRGRHVWELRAGNGDVLARSGMAYVRPGRAVAAARLALAPTAQQLDAGRIVVARPHPGHSTPGLRVAVSRAFRSWPFAAPREPS
jgi:hypothetical protein